MPLLAPAPQDVVDFVNETMSEYCPDLVKAGVKVDILMASPTEKEMEEPPPYLKNRGHTAAGLAKILNYELRCKGNGDAQVKLCWKTWKGLDEDERTGLIWHECLHFALATSKKTGEVKTDNAGRPVLKTRYHDYELGGFNVVAKRFGKKAIEVQEMHRVLKTYHQAFFDFRDDMAPQDGMSSQIAGIIKAAV